MARAYGLPADVALRAITLSPAEIFGVADRDGVARRRQGRGRVRGHRATSWTRAREVTHVLVDGAAQSLETRHTRLYREFMDRP